MPHSPRWLRRVLIPADRFSPDGHGFSIWTPDEAALRRGLSAGHRGAINAAARARTHVSRKRRSGGHRGLSSPPGAHRCRGAISRTGAVVSPRGGSDAHARARCRALHRGVRRSPGRCRALLRLLRYALLRARRVGPRVRTQTPGGRAPGVADDPRRTRAGGAAIRFLGHVPGHAACSRIASPSVGRVLAVQAVVRRRPRSSAPARGIWACAHCDTACIEPRSGSADEAGEPARNSAAGTSSSPQTPMADRSCRRAHGGSSSARIVGRRATSCPTTEPPVAVLVLRHSVPGLGELGYVPKGPGVAGADTLPHCVDGLRATAGSAFAIKVEPEIEQSPAAISALRAMGLEKSRHDVQISRATIIVDLRPDEDALLASFKPKCRYNIRLARAPWCDGCAGRRSTTRASTPCTR